MRIGPVLLMMLSLAACNRGSQNKDAVRQGVIDYFAGRGLNVASMDVQVTSVQFNGNQADASVSLLPKGAKASQAMAFQYHLQQKDNKWVVTGRTDAGQHGGGAMPGGAMPGGENPHGGGAAGAPGSGGQMPSPEDLPPTGKKK